MSEPAVDLGIAIALASSFRNKPISGRFVVAGEVGLTGEVRAVRKWNEGLQRLPTGFC